jgi:hypothetical protein
MIRDEDVFRQDHLIRQIQATPEIWLLGAMILDPYPDGTPI